MSDNENTNIKSEDDVNKKRPHQEVIDKMNRLINEMVKTGKTPGELEDMAYREMFE